MDVLMGVLDRLKRWYHEHWAAYPPPAFQTMRRGPETQQHEGLTAPNPLMVCHLGIPRRETKEAHKKTTDTILHLGLFSSHDELVETLRIRSPAPCRAWCHSGMATSSQQGNGTSELPSKIV